MSLPSLLMKPLNMVKFLLIASSLLKRKNTGKEDLSLDDGSSPSVKRSETNRRRRCGKRDRRFFDDGSVDRSSLSPKATGRRGSPFSVLIEISSRVIQEIFYMAVPKKRRSKTKKNIRKTMWKKKASEASRKAYSLAVVVLKKAEEKQERGN